MRELTEKQRRVTEEETGQNFQGRNREGNSSVIKGQASNDLRGKVEGEVTWWVRWELLKMEAGMNGRSQDVTSKDQGSIGKGREAQSKSEKAGRKEGTRRGFREPGTMASCY